MKKIQNFFLSGMLIVAPLALSLYAAWIVVGIADNIFSINRLGISDSFESGRSLTIGIDYKRESLDNIEKFFEFKLFSSRSQQHPSFS